MRLYTGVGDEGETGLLRGRRVSKASPVIEAIGEIDHLNAAIGWCRSQADVARHAALDDALQAIQRDLFELGAQLADGDAANPRLTAEDARRLEQLIDEFSAATPPIRRFILPAGNEGACRLHMARAVARRAERAFVRLVQNNEHPHREAGVYLNRLSDFLFASARYVNVAAGEEEQYW